MRSWRTRFIFLLIVYFAGFATAIYCLAPTPDKQTSQAGKKNLAFSALKSDEFAKSFNQAMHNCADFARDAAQRVAKFLKQKLEQRRLSANQ